MHYTPDKGATWKVISPDLSTNNPEYQKGDYGGLTLDISGAERYSSILTIAPSQLDEKLIWAGTDDGQVQLTTKGGKTWTNLTSNVTDMPEEGWIAQIQASTYNKGTAWMVVNNYRKGDYAPYLFKTDDFGKTWQRMVNGNTVRGYALTVIQDPVEPNLVFLGTEHGLWISIDEGQTWAQFKNGFPSVSTMDIKIQETESALIVGTFGRAIWVLDDLLSLREIAGNRLKEGLTALPMNDAVQVKGLFINPPGNIWTGFHTTFEGENKVFQKTEIPFYLSEVPKEGDIIKAYIFDSDGNNINSVETKDLTIGLNYVFWKLDEKSSSLPGSWTDDFSRDIPVLPGDYTIVLNYGTVSDTTKVRVISDPRFDLDGEVDRQLYKYRKAADVQVKRISEQLTSIDEKQKKVEKLLKQVSDASGKSNASLQRKIDRMKTDLKALKAKGQTPRPDRQVGAWQSFETSAYSKIKEVLQIAAAQTTGPSKQHWETLEQAKVFISEFSNVVDDFMKTKWQEFASDIKKSDLDWEVE